tara:strand:- start:1216 stop:1794 length:579 start_codon:yes stop_codon:yes gene_type:complete
MLKIIGIIILATVLSLIALSLFLTLSNNSLQTKEGSPENVIQTYIEFILEEKFNESYSLLSEEIKSECAFIEYINNIESEIELFERGNIKHTKTVEFTNEVASEIKFPEYDRERSEDDWDDQNWQEFEPGEHATVYIDISIVDTTIPFGTDEYTQEETIILTKENTQINDGSKWKILKTSFMNSCDIIPTRK